MKRLRDDCPYTDPWASSYISSSQAPTPPCDVSEYGRMMRSMYKYLTDADTLGQSHVYLLPAWFVGVCTADGLLRAVAPERYPADIDLAIPLYQDRQGNYWATYQQVRKEPTDYITGRMNAHNHSS